MSIVASRKLFSHLLSSHNKKYVKHLINVRLKSDENKIEAAVLRKYSEPLQIEKIDLPTKLAGSEVSNELYNFFIYKKNFIYLLTKKYFITLGSY